VKSPVMQALISASLREQEERESTLRAVVAKHLGLVPAEGDRSGWPLFKKWCEKQQITPFPARPASVAYFILENGALGIDELLRIVKSVSLVHEVVADPTASGVVPAALNKIKPIAEPRSWPATEKARFRQLPYEVQVYLSEREAQREKEVRRAQNDAAKARQELKAIQEPKHEISQSISA
jgi:hypothetical protein